MPRVGSLIMTVPSCRIGSFDPTGNFVLSHTEVCAYVMYITPTAEQFWDTASDAQPASDPPSCNGGAPTAVSTSRRPLTTAENLLP
jgi:hypothetical protein